MQRYNASSRKCVGRIQRAKTKEVSGNWKKTNYKNTIANRVIFLFIYNANANLKKKFEFS